MKRMLLFVVLPLITGLALAAPPNVSVQKRVDGSGIPGTRGPTAVTAVNPDGTMYAPQYLPGYPTSATIWPRVINVKCNMIMPGEVECEGYNWLPEYGRGEYLMIRPILAESPAPVVVPPTKIVVPVIKKKKAE